MSAHTHAPVPFHSLLSPHALHARHAQLDPFTHSASNTTTTNTHTTNTHTAAAHSGNQPAAAPAGPMLLSSTSSSLSLSDISQQHHQQLSHYNHNHHNHNHNHNHTPDQYSQEQAAADNNNNNTDYEPPRLPQSSASQRRSSKSSASSNPPPTPVTIDHSVPPGGKRFVCTEPDCGARFKTGTHLRRHRTVHSKDRPFVCPHAAAGCSSRFTRKDNLNQHIRHCRMGSATPSNGSSSAIASSSASLSSSSHTGGSGIARGPNKAALHPHPYARRGSLVSIASEASDASAHSGFTGTTGTTGTSAIFRTALDNPLLEVPSVQSRRMSLESSSFFGPQRRPSLVQSLTSNQVLERLRRSSIANPCATDYMGQPSADGSTAVSSSPMQPPQSSYLLYTPHDQTDSMHQQAPYGQHHQHQHQHQHQHDQFMGQHMSGLSTSPPLGTSTSNHDHHSTMHNAFGSQFVPLPTPNASPSFRNMSASAPFNSMSPSGAPTAATHLTYDAASGHPPRDAPSGMTLTSTMVGMPGPQLYSFPGPQMTVTGSTAAAESTDILMPLPAYFDGHAHAGQHAQHAQHHPPLSNPSPSVSVLSIPSTLTSPSFSDLSLRRMSLEHHANHAHAQQQQQQQQQKQHVFGEYGQYAHGMDPAVGIANGKTGHTDTFFAQGLTATGAHGDATDTAQLVVDASDVGVGVGIGVTSGTDTDLLNRELKHRIPLTPGSMPSMLANFTFL
ncbi:hypothetical protein BC831DRAFT_453487 [Entophlyctis helioformis]|nr:hypothetical protein BC831DRAFT_453487 [Entophlyctis helioformis]